MVLIYWWLAIILVAAAAGVLIMCWRRQKRPHDHKGLPIANSHYFTELPEYKKTVRLYRRLLIGFIGGLGVLLLSAIILSARYATITVDQPELRSRDVMLCLDVSGSMLEDDAKVVETFAKLADGFKGERLGLTMFDSSAVSVFPLTNDYDFIKERLAEIKEGLTSDNPSKDVTGGTTEGKGSSLIGDGLASCAVKFDLQEAKRSRSIILATDNGLAGNPLVTLQEAAGIAKDKDIRVYGLNPGEFAGTNWPDQSAEEYRQAMLLTGGGYYKFTDQAAVPGIIQQVQNQEATRFKGSPQLVQHDTPQWLAIIAFVAVTVMIVIGWRLGI